MSDQKSLVFLENPGLGMASKVVRKAISERNVVVLVGSCWVDYRGRASSKLGQGERIVLIKEDGSVLVHRPVKYEPVNWQPAGCLIQTRVSGDVLQVHAIRRTPSESIKIRFDRVYVLLALKLVDRGEFNLYASEEDMKRAILLDPSLIEAEFTPTSYEKKVDPGFMDIYGTDRNGKLVVVELKRNPASRDAVLQLAKYVDFLKATVNREVRGILVAPRLGRGVQRFLATLKLEFKALDPKKCSTVLRRVETSKLVDFFQQEAPS